VPVFQSPLFSLVTLVGFVAGDCFMDIVATCKILLFSPPASGFFFGGGGGWGWLFAVVEQKPFGAGY